MPKPVLMEPCVACKTCGPGREIEAKDHQDNLLHLGNLSRDEWSLPAAKFVSTHKGVAITVRVALAADVNRLVASPRVFPPSSQANDVLLTPLLNAYTSFNGQSYPYVCVAELDNAIVGRLYLDRNSNNSIRRELGAAVVDNLVVDPTHEGKGIADQLLEFAESVSRNNGCHWLEIGVRNSNETNEGHSRIGSDSFRSYLRLGYHEKPTYLSRPVPIHYIVHGVPNVASAECHRYGNTLVVYKNLDHEFAHGKSKQKQLFRDWTAEIPNS